MRPTFCIAVALACFSASAIPLLAGPDVGDESLLRSLYSTELQGSPVFTNLRELVRDYPGRLSGSKNLEGAVRWAKAKLEQAGAENVTLQPVQIPHWERGAPESVRYFSRQYTSPSSLAAVALGGSVPTPAGGLRAHVVELQSLEALKTTDVKGRIVFFNRPMDPTQVLPFRAYGGAGDQRNHGAAAAAKYGAVGVLVRSLTFAHDDVPHTGVTVYEDGSPRIPAAALSTIAADNLSAALKLDPDLEAELVINSRWFEDAPSHNVVGEIRGREHPEQVIVVGGHLDSWDIAPGAHDDGAGIVQSIEVLRLLKAAGYQPRHTIRCVCFVNEENGTKGALAYAAAAAARKESHLFALESDNGGFQPRGFQLGHADAAAHWRELLAPYAVTEFRDGDGGTDVNPLKDLGAVVGELVGDSQRYFDIHHTVEDSIDKVNPRELQLGAAAMAALVVLVDEHGL